MRATTVLMSIVAGLMLLGIAAARSGVGAAPGEGAAHELIALALIVAGIAVFVFWLLAQRRDGEDEEVGAQAPPAPDHDPGQLVRHPAVALEDEPIPHRPSPIAEDSSDMDATDTPSAPKAPSAPPGLGDS